MGEQQRIDATLNYIIKDFSGRTYMAESETMMIEGQKTFKKQFYPKNLLPGNYIIGLELVYPNGVATTSAHFSVVSRLQEVLRMYTAGMTIAILALFTTIIMLIVRYKKQKILS
jgi:hypothetical protein